MSSETTDVSICSLALSAIGADSIQSFEDETREAEVAGLHYGLVMDDLLSRHPWKFAIGQTSLAQLSATPLYGYQYAYQLPVDMVNLLSMELAAPYQIYEDKLYTDLEEVKVTYKFRPLESKMPAYFVRLVVLELAALFALAIAEDKEKAQSYAKLAERQEAKAKSTDSKQQPNRGIRDDNFVLVTSRYC